MKKTIAVGKTEPTKVLAIRYDPDWLRAQVKKNLEGKATFPTYEERQFSGEFASNSNDRSNESTVARRI